MALTAGLDAGSVGVKLVFLDENDTIVRHIYRTHHGRPFAATLTLLKEAVEEGFVGKAFPPMAVTGSSGTYIAQKLDIPHINELSALAVSVHRLYPDVRSVIEMGGEDSKLLILDGEVIKDFALNSVCAAGTGSFLDQQAERLRLSIEEFSETAAAAMQDHDPPKIAGRCSVFAKSDMIHLQQIATPVDDIVAGLCFSVAANFEGSIVRNRTMPDRTAFMGGVAQNKGMVGAFIKVFNKPDLLVPELPTMMSALGAAELVRRNKDAGVVSAERIMHLQVPQGYDDAGKSPLIREGDRFFERHAHSETEERAFDAAAAAAAAVADGRLPVYLGIDIGSISTCLAMTDEKGTLLCKRYLRTAGRPIEAVLTGLKEFRKELEDAGASVDVRGVGTTGSGRYMIADFIGADVVKNEITAQAAGAAFIDPKVDTIFEIGGQDSKYIRLQDGIIIDFEMNKACAAGTGSFLEEQAEKLDISIKQEFATMALQAEHPCRLGERCTVFMENSLQSALQQGAGKDDLLAGLAYSIVENYINRVVSGRSIGKNIFFQGGTAFNKAVTAAFEKYLDTEITVPPNHDNTGAIGMALISVENMKSAGGSRFKGFDLADRRYEQSSFQCSGCENQCEINKIKIDGEDGNLFYGGRCEKYDIRQRIENPPPDHFAFRVEALEKAHKEYRERFESGKRKAKRGVIGLPRVFFMHDYLPYYATLLWSLGFEVVVSPRTNKRIKDMGVRMTMADTCYPIKTSMGHVEYLRRKDVDTLFIPSFVNMAGPDDPYENAHACPLTQSFPYQMRTAMQGKGLTFVVPVVKHKHGEHWSAKELTKAFYGFGVGYFEVRTAMRKAAQAQEQFRAAVRERGREFLERTARAAVDAPRLVILGRAYNAYDMGLNLEIPKKLAALKVESIPMDFLPPEDVYEDWPEMYWNSGRNILSAAKVVKKNPKLHALFIGNFSCGPDSFIHTFFSREMGDKPYLHIEIDEHSADAGVVTRCEAFLDGLEMQSAAGDLIRKEKSAGGAPRRTAFLTDQGKKRRVYVPRMCDHALAVEAAFRYCGVDARVLPETDREAVALAGKYISGKECYPFAVTTGDILKKAFSSDFEPDKSAFLMWSGTGPCRFGQYNVMQRIILEKAGFPEVAVYSPVQDVEFYNELGIIGREYSTIGWIGVVAMDLLMRCLHETRPYEKEPGACDVLYADYAARIHEALIHRNGDLNVPLEKVEALLSEMRRDFENLPKIQESKPLIGIVGEIFVRSNRFSNEDLVRRVEDLGGEAWLAPMDEWIYYVNWGAFENAKIRKELKKLVTIGLTSRAQKKLAHRLERPMNGGLKTIHDPDVKTILKNASPYLHHSFRGEAVLSVGKTMDMLSRGCLGIINAMPFGCMPGTVVTALLRSMSVEYGFPAISIPYDGTASSTMKLQLETFMEQAALRMDS